MPPAKTIVDGRTISHWAPDVLTPDTPLLLCHDGQNLFSGEHSLSGAGWRLDDALVRLGAQGMTVPVVVGPWSDPATRGMEYVPQAVLEADESVRRGFVDWYGDQPLAGDDYADWCAGPLVDWAAEAFGLDLQASTTAVMGSSMGGLASLYALSRHPEAYGTALSLSTHWTPGGPALPGLMVGGLPTACRVWLDHGSLGLDADYALFQRAAADALDRRGWSAEIDYVARVYPGAGHDERAWAERAADPLVFWLAGRDRLGP